MEKEVNIYVLVDPLSCKVRYVGITTKSLEKRLYKHIDESMYSKKNTHKINWIRKLISKGRLPIIRKLLKVNNWNTALKIERELIKKYKVSRNLTNSEDYISGVFKRGLTDAQKLQISKKTKAFYESGGIAGNSKKVKCFKINGEFIRNFESMTEASKILNLSLRHICNVVSGKKSQIKGYIFRKINDDNPSPINFDPHQKLKKKIQILDLETGVVQIYNSQTEAANALNVSSGMITYYLKNPSSLKNKKIMNYEL